MSYGIEPGEVAETEPVTSHASKKVMLRAEHGDSVLINGWFEAEVVERLNGYYGPRLTLYNEQTGHNYKLHGGGFDTELIMWESVLTEDNFIKGWRKVGEVSAKIAETSPYEICDHCGDAIRSRQHRKFSALRMCRKVEDPNTWGSGMPLEDTGGEP